MKNVVERGSLDPVMAVDGYKSGNLDGQAATHVTHVFHGGRYKSPIDKRRSMSSCCGQMHMARKLLETLHGS